MRRSLAILVAAVLAITVVPAAGPVGAATDEVKACFVWPYDEGCTTDLAVAIGWYAKLRAKAPWHANGSVYLFQSDPGETGFHRVAKLRFNEKGRATWRWDAPSEVQCCWRWKFKAIADDGSVLDVSNRLRAEAAPGD